jgi:multiple sugar transport system permease protein
MAVAMKRSEPTGATGKALARRWPRGLVKHGVLVAVGLLMLYPMLWMVGSSFKPTATIFTDLGLWPQPFTLDNYVKGWTTLRIPFGRFFLNSFIVAAGSVVGNVLACSLAAYAFARIDFRFKRAWFALMLGTIMLPQHVLVVPQYILFLKADWVNTYLPLIVPKFLATNAFFIFLMVQFIRGLPRELDDAAKLDGAGPFQIYWRIILPLSLPALATTAIFTFIWTWDDFFTQLIYLNDSAKYTIPIALRQFLDSSGGDSSWGPMFAMSILSLVPTFVVFLVSQRLIIQGLSTSGMKG